MSVALGPRSASTSTLRTLLVMVGRDVRVLRRELADFLGRAVLQPLFFVFTFAYVLPTISGRTIGGKTAGANSYATILVPGMVAMTMIITGIVAVTIPLATELSYFREIEDRLLAPISVRMLAWQKIFSGAIQSLIGGIIVFPIIYFVHAGNAAPQIQVANWPLFVVAVLSTAGIVASLGLLIGTVVKAQQINVLFSVVLVPGTMLGCVYYPWAALHAIPWLRIAVLFNPAVYCSEGLRAALTPQVPHMPLWALVPALVGGVAVTASLGVRSFARRAIN